ncbi:MAG: phosphoheptose isomerase [Planctomycetota bacterium]
MANSSAKTWRDTLEEHRRVMHGLDSAAGALEPIAAAIVRAFRQGRRLYLIGNGGSAADAQHIAGELLGRFKRERRPLPAIALTTDTSTMTAVANDYEYDRVFARQVEGLIGPGDVLWCLSTSGNSPSILAAAALARERGAIVVGFTGETGGKLASLCDHAFKVPHASSDRIQEGHILAYHFLCEQIEAAFA